MRKIKIPSDVKIEEAVIGAMLLEKPAVDTCLQLITKPEIFYNEKHQLIFIAIKNLREEFEPVDLLTVTDKLRSTGGLERAGGAAYVTGLTMKVNSAVHIEKHVAILIEYWMRRFAIRVCQEINKLAYDESVDIFETIDKSQIELLKIREALEIKKPETMKEVVITALSEIAEAAQKPNNISGVPSGIGPLDKATAGWQDGNLILIAARPGMGKTALILAAARNAAIDFDEPGLFFSLEMRKSELVKRLMAGESDIENSRLTKGKLTESEFARLHNSISKLLTDKVLFDDDARSLSSVRSKAVSAKAKHKIKWIIIDYLQLMSGDGKNRGNREQEIASISRGLKNLAKELDVPVIALSQLSRDVEKRPDKRPQLSDLRESGSLEQDADMVIFLFRPEYYGIELDEQGNSLKGVMELIIAKQRNGSIGSEIVRAELSKNKFYELDSYDSPQLNDYNPNKFTESNREEEPF